MISHISHGLNHMEIGVHVYITILCKMAKLVKTSSKFCLHIF